MIHVEDKTLTLPDGRTLAYADNGNTSSSSLVLFLHGAFSVGDASRLPQVLLDKKVHFIAPSLPGWGKSSPIPPPSSSTFSWSSWWSSSWSLASSYATTLAADITHLITHLHPKTKTSKLRLYLCGHSFGTVPAQILHGLPHDIFPLGKQIAGLVLLAPLSPPHRHSGYARGLSWQNYLTLGPPARYTPFNLFTRLVRMYVTRQFSSEAAARAYVQKTVIWAMDDEEREAFARWMEDHGLSEGQFEKETVQILMRSVKNGWQGFLDIPAIYHYGWGSLRPEKVVNDCPVLVVSSGGDYFSSQEMARWLSSAYQSIGFKNIDGNHYSVFLHLDDIWEEIFRSSEMTMANGQ